MTRLVDERRGKAVVEVFQRDILAGICRDGRLRGRPVCSVTANAAKMNKMKTSFGIKLLHEIIHFQALCAATMICCSASALHYKQQPETCAVTLCFPCILSGTISRASTNIHFGRTTTHTAW